MALDRAKLERVLKDLGNRLRQPTTLCIFDSAPAIPRSTRPGERR